MKFSIYSKAPARTKIVAALCEAIEKQQIIYHPSGRGYYLRTPESTLRIRNSEEPQKALEEIYLAYAFNSWLKKNVKEQADVKPTLFDLASAAATMGWKVETFHGTPWDGKAENLGPSIHIYIGENGYLLGIQNEKRFKLILETEILPANDIYTEQTPADVFLKTLARLPEIREQLLEQEDYQLLKNELGKFRMQHTISSGAVEAQLRELLGITSKSHFHVNANEELWYYTNSGNLYGFRLNPEIFFEEAPKAIAFGKRLEDLLLRDKDGRPRPFSGRLVHSKDPMNYGSHICLETGLFDNLYAIIPIENTMEGVDMQFLAEAKRLTDDLQQLAETAKKDADMIYPIFIQPVSSNIIGSLTSIAKGLFLQ